MNKKLFALPLAVAAMGLASCNKAWPLVTDEESKTIAANILNVDAVKKLLQSDPSGLNDTANFKATEYHKKTQGKGILEEESFNIAANLNKDKNYYSLKMTAEGINSEEHHKMNGESTMYFTYKDNAAFALNKESKIGNKTSYTEDIYKTTIKQMFYLGSSENEEDYCYYGIVKKGYDMLTNWNTYLGKLKNLHDQYKDDKTFYVNYEIRSNNKTDSARFILDAKTKMDINSSSNMNKDPDYDYVINKADFTYTNGIITKMSYTWEAKEEGVDTIETYKGTLDSIAFGSASMDSINLDDYQVFEE